MSDRFGVRKLTTSSFAFAAKTDKFRLTATDLPLTTTVSRTTRELQTHHKIWILHLQRLQSRLVVSTLLNSVFQCCIISRKKTVLKFAKSCHIGACFYYSHFVRQVRLSPMLQGQACYHQQGCFSNKYILIIYIT